MDARRISSAGRSRCCAARRASARNASSRSTPAPASPPSTCIWCAEKGDKIISIDDLDGLIALVQAGVLEIHTRGTTIDDREHADRLVFDLDPGPGTSWHDVVAAARDVRERLAAMKLKSFVKTTGGKGLHVVLPIKPTPWDEAKDFAHAVAAAMAHDAPDRYVATATKAKRNNRIFIDYLRNSREATAVAPYSTRARPGAAVSTPVGLG